MAGQETLRLWEQTVGERNGGQGLASPERMEGALTNERGGIQKFWGRKKS